jgi:hypothetical protein
MREADVVDLVEAGVAVRLLKITVKVSDDTLDRPA